MLPGRITNKVIRALRCLVFLGEVLIVVRWVGASLDITNKVIRALRCLIFLGDVLVVVRWVCGSLCEVIRSFLVRCLLLLKQYRNRICLKIILNVP